MEAKKPKGFNEFDKLMKKLVALPPGAVMKNIIDAIVQDVAELPNRSSPDDWPEAMLVTSDELRDILRKHLSTQPDFGELKQGADGDPDLME